MPAVLTLLAPSCEVGREVSGATQTVMPSIPRLPVMD